MMATPAIVQSESLSRLSYERELLKDRVPDIGIIRRDSTSTTGSGKPLPPGHWTLPISGNCPRCRHHHKSVKIHVRNTNNSSGMVDLHCKRCNKLWLGSGSRNSTRVSLASNDTLDQPAIEPEIRSTLAHMVRAATRVGTLSPTLPNITEGVVVPSRGPPDQSHITFESRVTADYVDGDEPGTILGTASAAQTPGTSANRLRKFNTNSANNTRSPRFILRLHRRLGRTFPNLRTTRLGRLMKIREDHELSAVDCGPEATLEPVTESDAAISQPINMQAPPTGISGENSEHEASKEMDICVPPAIATQGLNSRMIVNQEVINVMTPEQRIALLRSQITAFSTRFNSAHATTAPNFHPHGNGEHPLETLATLAAIHNSLLTGTGNHFGEYHYLDVFQQSEPIFAPGSLSISETRISEAPTVVNGQVFAPPDLVREILSRGIRLSGQLPPLSSQSTVQSWDQIRRDTGDIRSSFESSMRDRSSFRNSRQSMVPASVLYNTEASASQPHLTVSHGNATEHDISSSETSSPHQDRRTSE